MNTKRVQCILAANLSWKQIYYRFQTKAELFNALSCLKFFSLLSIFLTENQQFSVKYYVAECDIEKIISSFEPKEALKHDRNSYRLLKLCATASLNLSRAFYRLHQMLLQFELLLPKRGKNFDGCHTTLWDMKPKFQPCSFFTVCILLLTLWRNYKFLCCFDHFSRSYEVTKIWIWHKSRHPANVHNIPRLFFALFC